MERDTGLLGASAPTLLGWRTSTLGGLMPKLIGATTAAVALSVVAPVPVATATSGCVTRAEYQKIHRGDTRARVHRVFDTRGKRESLVESDGFRSEVRSYTTCSEFSSVTIVFDKHGKRPWRVFSKSAVWVS
jgi:hypothetical protein